AKTGWSMKQRVVHGFATHPRAFDKYAQVGPCLGLTDEIFQPLRAQGAVFAIAFQRLGPQQGVGLAHLAPHGPAPAPVVMACRRAMRSSVGGWVANSRSMRRACSGLMINMLAEAGFCSAGRFTTCDAAREIRASAEARARGWPQ